MKTGIVKIALLCAATMAAAGCEKNPPAGNAEVQRTFDQMFPEAQRVEWEMEDGHWVAEFVERRVEKEAWFEPSGVWKMTDCDIAFRKLPQPVRAAFEASQYADWRVEDCDHLQRAGMQDVYIIEVERGDQDRDLYYLADGTLCRETTGGDDNGSHLEDLPHTTPAGVAGFLDQRYPGHIVVDIDREDRGIEVEIVHQGDRIEVWFDRQGTWVQSSREVTMARVPQAVAQALAASQYASWRVDDIDFLETPQHNAYLFELELGDRDKMLLIREDGTLL